MGTKRRFAACGEEEELSEASALVRARTEWRAFVPCHALVEGEVHCRPGDCMFACVAFWLNCALGSTQYDSCAVRRLAAAALHENELFFEAVLQDLACESGCELTKTAAQAALQRPGVWGSCGALVLLAKALSWLLHMPVGFVILKTRDGAYSQAEPMLLPSPKTQDAGRAAEPLLACVLFHVNEDHYRLAASSAPGPLRVLFDPRERTWGATLRRATSRSLRGSAAMSRTPLSTIFEKQNCMSP